MDIFTRRLRLVALTLNQLKTYRMDPGMLERELGLTLSRDFATADVERAVGMKIDKMERANPSMHDWHTYWLLVVRETGFGAGMAGFKGAPDADGWVEIGYGIDPSLQGRGLMTEACRGLIDWAFAHPECVSVGAPGVRADNPASCRVLQKLGFRVIRRGAADVDWILDRPATPAGEAE